MMWPNYVGDGWSVLWGMGMMVLFWGAIIALVVWAIRTFSRSRPTDEPAIDILRRRFAAGEISQDDFEKSKRALGV